jgi:hypothetical protein
MSDQPEPVTVVETIIVKQDVGGPFPVYKKVQLNLLSDGTVTWQAPPPPKPEPSMENMDEWLEHRRRELSDGASE